jgi:hypothetical protein
MIRFTGRQYNITTNPVRILAEHVRSYRIQDELVKITFRSGATLRYASLDNIVDPQDNHISYLELNQYNRLINFLQTVGCTNED